MRDNEATVDYMRNVAWESEEEDCSGEDLIGPPRQRLLQPVEPRAREEIGHAARKMSEFSKKMSSSTHTRMAWWYFGGIASLLSGSTVLVGTYTEDTATIHMVAVVVLMALGYLVRDKILSYRSLMVEYMGLHHCFTSIANKSGLALSPAAKSEVSTQFTIAFDNLQDVKTRTMMVALVPLQKPED